jgi:hypothetical protein
MAPYDSDSSGGEDDDYTETNVLLGYASKEPSDDTISYLGGRPVCQRTLICLSFLFGHSEFSSCDPESMLIFYSSDMAGPR